MDETAGAGRSLGIERRRDTRRPTIRRCRVRTRRSLLFASGITHNVSGGGVLLALASPRPLSIGDEVEVVVAWDEDAVVQAGNAIRGRVIRIESHPQEQRVAVAYDERLPVAQVNPVRVAA